MSITVRGFRRDREFLADRNKSLGAGGRSCFITARVRLVGIATLLVIAPSFAETNEPDPGVRPLTVDPDSRPAVYSGMERSVRPRPAPRVADLGFRLADPRPVELREHELASLERKDAMPASLASSDFNGDGVVDLVVGYRATGGVVVALLIGDRTNPRSPFTEGATLFDTPAAPDFLATGDFDNDGHQDLVLGERGRRRGVRGARFRGTPVRCLREERTTESKRSIRSGSSHGAGLA